MTPPTPSPLSRREALRRIAAGASALSPGGWIIPRIPGWRQAGDGRLHARVRPPSHPVAPGLHRPGLGGSRDGLLYVPAGYRAGTAAPLAVLLHGAGQEAAELFIPMKTPADESGLILLALDSRNVTWDVIHDDYGPDIRFIDLALTWAFDRVRVDPARVGVAGFSDGASYALSIGRINGELFRKVAAFSPGFVARGQPAGHPKFFITHGTQDPILPIDGASRRIVPNLKAQGYQVEYHEFDGPHAMNRELLKAAAVWLAAP